MIKIRFAKRLMTYTLAAAMLLGVGFLGTSFDSNAETQYIIVDTAKVRNAANGQDVINGVSKGTAVEILSSEAGSDGKVWNKVSYVINGIRHEGWVRSDLMSATQPQTETTTPDDSETTQPDTQEPADTQTPDAQPDTQTPDEGDGDVVDFMVPDSNACGDGYQANGDLTFDVMGETLTISSGFTAEQIPVNFSKIDITYSGQNITCLQYYYADVKLAYLTGADGSGEFFVLDTDQKIVHSYVTIAAGDHSLIILTPPTDVQVAECYEKTVYAADQDSVVTAYQYNELLDTVSVTTVAAEYYYVYGVTQSGEPGWYLYDDVEKTYIRATSDLSVDLNTLVSDDATPVQDPNDSLEKMMIVVLAGICFIFLVMIIVFGIRAFCAKRKLRRYEEEHLPVTGITDEEEEEEELSFFQRRKQEREYRHFLEHFGEELNEEMDDEEVEKEIPETLNLMEELKKEGFIENPDYDYKVSDQEDYDLTDENSEKDFHEFDDIENILLAGLADTISELDKEQLAEETEPTKMEDDSIEEITFMDEAEEESIDEVEEESIDETEEESTDETEEESQDKESEEDEWKDLEFINL